MNNLDITMGKRLWLALAVLVVIVAAIWISYARGKTDGKAAAITPTPKNQVVVSFATPRPTPKPTPTTSTSLPRCMVADLKIFLTQPSGGAGHTFSNIGFNNISAHDCALQGFPGVSLVDASGKQLGQPAIEAGTSTFTPIKIVPNQSIYAAVVFPDPGNFNPGTCSAAATQLKVFPPGATDALFVPVTYASCPGWAVDTLQETAQ